MKQVVIQKVRRRRTREEPPPVWPRTQSARPRVPMKSSTKES